MESAVKLNCTALQASSYACWHVIIVQFAPGMSKKKKKRNNFRSIAQYVSSFTFNKVCQKSSTSVVLKSTCQCQKLPTEYHLEIWRLGNVITYDNKENLKQISQTAPTSQSLTFVWKLEGSLHYDCHYHNVTLVHDLQNNTAFYFFLLCKLASVP